jgi:hypothetical protein
MQLDLFNLAVLLFLALWVGGYIASKYQKWTAPHRLLKARDEAVMDAAEDALDNDHDNGGRRLS